MKGAACHVPGPGRPAGLLRGEAGGAGRDRMGGARGGGGAGSPYQSLL